MASDRLPGDGPTNRWPPDFRDWPVDAQIRQVTMRMTRRGLIDECLSHAGLDPKDYDIQDDAKLTKDMLASIYLTLEGFNNGR